MSLDNKNNIPVGGMTVGSAVGRESAALMVAEGAAAGVSLGAIFVLDSLIPKEIMHSVCHVVSKVIITPFQDIIECGMKKLSKLDEFHVDETKPREQRAEEYAHALIIYGGAFATSLWSKLKMRRVMNDLVGVGNDGHKLYPEGMGFVRRKFHDMNFMNWSPSERLIFAADEGVHLGAMAFMNMNQKAADKTDDIIEKVTGILEHLGVSHESAKKWSNYLTIYEFPNAVAFGGAVLGVAYKHGYKPSTGQYHKFEDIWKGLAESERVFGRA